VNKNKIVYQQVQVLKKKKVQKNKITTLKMRKWNEQEFKIKRREMTVLNWSYHNLTTEILIEKLNNLESPDKISHLSVAA
jgi:ABC-type ATPase involved in cell division